jgi:hypothetical protein
MFKKKSKGNFCPLLKKECIEHECSWYMHVRGMNPNTGEDVDHWNCAVSWMPMLTIENSQQQRQTNCTIDAFRNEVHTANETNKQIYIEGLQEQGILPVNVTPMTNSLLKGEEGNETDNN